MALVEKMPLQDGTMLGLWRVDETVAQLQVLGNVHKQVCEAYTSNKRRLEVLCTYALLFALTDDVSLRIEHLPYGKPLCVSHATGRRYYISVSHTKGYAALILSRNQEVAVDIEYFSDRVERISSKFLRMDENASDLDSKLVHWCAKETVYKLFSEENLKFDDMRVKPFDTMSDWACDVENLKNKKVAHVDFELTMEFVLTYAAM